MYLFLPLWHTHTNLLTRLSVIVTLDINKILTPQRSIETQSKFIFGHKLNHFELARVAKCWWCTEITLGGGPLCMHNVIGEVVVPSDAGLILRHCPSLPVRPLWSEGWRSTEGVFWTRGVDSQEHIQNRSAGARIYLQCH